MIGPIHPIGHTTRLLPLTNRLTNHLVNHLVNQARRTDRLGRSESLSPTNPTNPIGLFRPLGHGG
ncbi:MAG TPA: hypothetical protein VIS06_03035, partial [Mycobacteriales bacterium]